MLSHLLAAYLHVVGDVREDGWFDEISLVPEPLSAGLQLRSLRLAALHVSQNPLELLLAHLEKNNDDLTECYLGRFFLLKRLGNISL